MSHQLYVLKNDVRIIQFYSDLDKAKSELKNIYNKKPDFKHYGYFINIYNLEDGEYKYSKTSYSYKLDEFIIHNDK